jgi:hypothetical protein
VAVRKGPDATEGFVRLEVGQWGSTLLPHMVQDAFKAADFYDKRAALQLRNEDSQNAEKILSGETVLDGRSLTQDEVKGMAQVFARQTDSEATREMLETEIYGPFVNKHPELGGDGAGGVLNGKIIRGWLVGHRIFTPSKAELEEAFENLRETGELQLLATPKR